MCCQAHFNPCILGVLEAFLGKAPAPSCPLLPSATRQATQGPLEAISGVHDATQGPLEAIMHSAGVLCRALWRPSNPLGVPRPPQITSSREASTEHEEKLQLAITS